MAKNLRAKIPASDTLVIRDVNTEAMDRFVRETREAAKSTGAGADGMKVEIAESPRQVAEKSVSYWAVQELVVYNSRNVVERNCHASKLGSIWDDVINFKSRA